MTGATVLHGLGDLVLVLNREQRVVGTYGRWVQTRRVSSSEYTGKQIAGAWPQNVAAFHVEMNARALDGQVVTYDWEYPAPGSGRRMMTVIVPIYAADGHRVSGIIRTARELSGDAPAVSTQMIHLSGRRRRSADSASTGDLMRRLSPREREIVALLLDSARSAQIARTLQISVHTVRQHLKNILKKAGVHSQPELLDVLRGRLHT